MDWGRKGTQTTAGDLETALCGAPWAPQWSTRVEVFMAWPWAGCPVLVNATRSAVLGGVGGGAGL